MVNILSEIVLLLAASNLVDLSNIGRCSENQFWLQNRCTMRLTESQYTRVLFRQVSPRMLMPSIENQLIHKICCFILLRQASLLLVVTSDSVTNMTVVNKSVITANDQASNQDLKLSSESFAVVFKQTVYRAIYTKHSLGSRIHKILRHPSG